MSNTDIRKLPPMTALEFAIEQTFRNFFYSLRLVLGWALLLSPLFIAAYFVLFRSGIPDFKALPPSSFGLLIAIAAVSLLASFSIAVNWHRRILLGETPRRLGWVRLNSVVFKYVLGFLVVITAVGILASAAIAAVSFLPSALTLNAGMFGLGFLSGAEFQISGLNYLLAVILGISGLFTWYRLSSWLPALATGDSNYALRTAWRVTRKNRIRFLGFTFWLLFGLATAAAIGAGAFFGQQALGNPWVTIGAFVLIGLLAWLALFLLMTIATSHYFHFATVEVEAEKEAVQPLPEAETA